MKQAHIESLEKDLKYWQTWTTHEEKILPDCPEDTKPYILKRIAMGLRNIKELEKALDVLDDKKETSTSTNTDNSVSP